MGCFVVYELINRIARNTEPIVSVFVTAGGWGEVEDLDEGDVEVINSLFQILRCILIICSYK